MYNGKSSFYIIFQSMEKCSFNHALMNNNNFLNFKLDFYAIKANCWKIKHDSEFLISLSKFQKNEGMIVF